MLGVVIKDLVVDLIGQNQQGVLPGDVHNLLQNLAGVHGTRGVIRVDHYDCFGALGDLGANILDGGVPVILFITEVMHGLAASQRGSSSPQWVIRGGDQHLIAVVEQSLGGHGDQLGDTIAQKDIFNVELGEARDHFIAGTNCPTRADNALGRGVTLRIRQRGNHVSHDHIGRLEAENCRIAGVQLEDAVAIRLHALRFRIHGSADFIKDVLQLGRLIKRAQLTGSKGSTHSVYSAS